MLPARFTQRLFMSCVVINSQKDALFYILYLVMAFFLVEKIKLLM